MTAYKYQTKKGIRWEYLTNYVDFDGKKRQKHQQGFKTKKEALEAERVFLTTKKFDHDTPLRAMIPIYSKRFSAYNSIRGFNVMLKVFDSFLDKPIASISQEEVEEFLKEMDVKPSTKSIYGARFSRFYNFSAKRCAVPQVMSLKTKTPRRDYQIYTLEQYTLFSSYLDTVSKVFFDLLYFTGIRKGEALALKKSDISDTVSITKTRDESGTHAPKTPNSVRKVALPDFLKDELEDYMSRLYGDDLFPVNYAYFKPKQKKAEQAAGLPHIRIHDFRHSHASWLISMNINVADISHRLGHASIQTTLNIYSHLYQDKDKDIANMIQKSVKNP